MTGASTGCRRSYPCRIAQDTWEPCFGRDRRGSSPCRYWSHCDTSVVAQGTSWINFNASAPSLGITNETIYLDLNYTNGTVTLDISDFPEWSDWSEYWKIGQTSVGDIDLDMDVDSVDVNLLRNDYLNITGIDDTDLNNDGVVNYLDRSLIQNFWGDDYT